MIAVLGSIFWNSDASVHSFYNTFPFSPPDTTKTDELRYKFKDVDGNPLNDSQNSKLFLSNPKNIDSEIEYDAKSHEYIFTNKIGNINYRVPQVMPFEEYKNYDFNSSIRKYWQQKANGESSQTQSGLTIPKLHVGGEAFDKIFGSNVIDIKPQGSAELIFGFKINSSNNPRLDEKNRRTTSFDFNEKITMNVTGQIGDKMKLNTSYNTEATFDFENKMNLSYDGKEDEIIKKIQAGDVNLPLSGSLITGSQSLFGLKTELQFGKLTVTSVLSQQKGKTQVIEVQGGAQTSYYEVNADDYEANRHFFIAPYFYKNYERFLEDLIAPTPITITKMEVWVTNKSGKSDDSRNIVAFTNLGENQGEYPRNDADTSNVSSSLYDTLTHTYPNIRDIYQITKTLENVYSAGRDYEKIENARKLEPSEYKYNPQLGYISLNSALNSDEVLAVAYQYTVAGESGVIKVGEFSTGGIVAPNTLFLKLIRGTSFTPKHPNWKLMMKNVYSTGAYQIQKEGFELNIMYQNDKTGKAVPYISEGKINNKLLIDVLNLDKLNSQQDVSADGAFDFVEGKTVIASNGRIIFPVLEPFGEYLRKQIGDDIIANKYVFEELYDSTQSKARQIAEKNKFFITGKYASSSSSEISLNAMNVPQGSVVVSAGGVALSENQDYTVDYTLGRVKIINKGLLESGTPIKISLENNSAFAMQSKTLMGSRLDYKVSNDFTLGGTIINLTERPFTQKVNIGDEAISNTIWGLDGTYRTDLPLLTKMIDLLPFIDTKEMSNVTIVGEFAHFIPGHSRSIGKTGLSYIDDFEGTKSSIDLGSHIGWTLASTPQKQNSGDIPLFPEGNLIDELEYGYNRAKISWYTIDPLFLRNNIGTPTHIKENPDLQSSHLVREVFETEIFPNKDLENGIANNLTVLNISYFPKEKGPYNFDVNPTTFSKGIDINGKLIDPKTRWGGIMKSLQTNDFEESNIEYIEFWLMDPFVENSSGGGDLYINLGDISEDILRDSRKAYENGLPTPANNFPIDTTKWGVVPVVQSIVSSFDNDESSRKLQDVGFDGLSNADEILFFSDYLNSIASKFNSTSTKAYRSAFLDPSNDNFHYFKGSDYDTDELGIIERYKKYNLSEGNSPTANQSIEDYQTTGTVTPDAEDINKDYTLSEAENYFQYRVSLRKTDLEVGKNFITDKVEYTATFANKENSTVSWYQFKVPITQYESVFGDISDFKSIRFVRLFMKNFEDSITLRLAKFDLVRGEWRKYSEAFNEGAPAISIPEVDDVLFDVSAVSIEENGKKTPVNYILPPGLSRNLSVTGSVPTRMNEQSIVLKVCNLGDGNAKAAYKNVELDIRPYKRLEMFVHAESLENEPEILNNDLCAFIRIGSDYQNNFYEYEIPLEVTPAGYYNDENEDTSNVKRKQVWPDNNKINLVLEDLISAKQERNDEMRKLTTSVTYNTLYEYKKAKNGRIRIVGNPNLSNVKTILIGVRNRSKQSNNVADDGQTKCAEVWMNELRLADFDESTGWAANARMTTKMADFGTVTISGSTMKPGFGSIEKKVSERNKEEINQFDLSSNFELGKFLPEKVKVSVPMYLGYSRGVKNPKYDPLDPDVQLKDVLENLASKEERENKKSTSRDYTRRKSINFTNVKLNSVSEKPKILSLSNLALNYSYSEILMRNVSTEHNISKNFRGGFVYNFSGSPKEVEPFKNVSFMKSKSWRIIKDFNFGYLPQQFTVRWDMDRQYNEVQLRSLGTTESIDPFYNKNFLWSRNYDLKYNITKNLKFDFQATNQARIDEPIEIGRVNNDNVSEYKAWNDSIWKGIFKGGRNTNHYNTFNLQYTLPINKIPIFDWVNISGRYSANYDWIVAPITKNYILGNTIKNSNSKTANGTLNMKTLFNKVPYFKEIDQKRKKNQNKKPQIKKVTYEEINVNLKANISKTITHNLKTEEEIVVKAYNDKGVLIQGEVEIISENKIKFTTKEEIENVKIVVVGSKEDKDNLLKKIVDNTIVLATSITNINISYSENNGSLLPGFMPTTPFWGLKQYNPTSDGLYNLSSSQSLWAPGLPFIFGKQNNFGNNNQNFAEYAASNHWLTNDSSKIAYATTNVRNLNLKATVEPLNGLKIDLTTNYNKSKNSSTDYYSESSDVFSVSNNIQRGTFTMSICSFNTSFDKISLKNGYNSASYERFKKYREIFAERKASDDGTYNTEDINGIFPQGYNSRSQEVMSLAFLAAYTKSKTDIMPLTAMPDATRMRPNWSFTYNGLSKIPFLKKYIKSANIRHSYRSSYSVGSYITNLEYNSNLALDEQLNFISQFDLTGVTISENFSPLISIDIGLSNSLTTKFEIKKTRNVNLGFSNSQIIEVKSNELVFGFGYRIKDVPIRIKSGSGEKKEYKSDLNIRSDFSIKDNISVTHIIEEDVHKATEGKTVIALSNTADYALNQRFNIQIYLKYQTTIPIIASTNKTSLTEFGISVKFSLTQ